MSSPSVPDDVFAPDFVWKGSYHYKGQKQPMSLIVTSFNATTGKVNVTLTDSSMEFLLSGESFINHLSVTSWPAPPLSTSPQHLWMSLPFILRAPCQSVNQQMISCMRLEINYWSKRLMKKPAQTVYTLWSLSFPLLFFFPFSTTILRFPL